MQPDAQILISHRFQLFCHRGAIFLYLLILVWGSVPGARQEIAQYASGWVLHSMAYAVIATLIFIGRSGSRTPRALRAILTVVVMGALDEWFQSFLPYRTAAIIDWMVDTMAAAAIASSLWMVWPWLVRRFGANAATE